MDCRFKISSHQLESLYKFKTKCPFITFMEGTLGAKQSLEKFKLKDLVIETNQILDKRGCYEASNPTILCGGEDFGWHFKEAFGVAALDRGQLWGFLWTQVDWWERPPSMEEWITSPPIFRLEKEGWPKVRVPSVRAYLVEKPYVNRDRKFFWARNFLEIMREGGEGSKPTALGGNKDEFSLRNS